MNASGGAFPAGQFGSGSSRLLCLVLGGAGFLGSHIVKHLVQNGYRVRILDRQKTILNFEHSVNQVQICFGDISDARTVKSCMEGVSYLFHYASSSLPTTSNLNPEEDVLVNLPTTVRVLSEAAKSGVKRVIFPSSGGTIYGVSQRLPISETHPTNPISSYGIVKLTIEKYLDLFRHLHGLDYVVLRYANPYGEHQNPFRRFGIVGTILARLARKQPVEVWGDGSIVRDFVYAPDAAEATVSALQYVGSERIFNVGSGMGTSIIQLIEIVQEVTGRRVDVMFGSARSSDVPSNILDISRARKEFNWVPKTGLRDGVALTWNWIRNEGLGGNQIECQ